MRCFDDRASDGAAASLRVDFHFDFLCPWCWIGARNLRAALAQLQAARPDLQVDWRAVSVQLLPQVPPEGLPYEAFYLARLGSPEAVAARRAQVVAAAQAAGLVLNHAAIERLPNTLLAHRLLAAARDGLAPEALYGLMDAVFAAYFQHGQDIGDAATLARLAREHGVPDAALQAWQGSEQRLNPQASAVHGVPLVVFNGRHAVSGAQPPQVWLGVMRQVLDSAPTPA